MAKKNYEAELAVLKALVLEDEREVQEDILLALEPADFTDELNQSIFKYAAVLWKAGRIIDLVTLAQLVPHMTEQNDIVSHLTRFVNACTPSTANYRTHIATLKASAASRKLVEVAKKIIKDAEGDAFKARDAALRELQDITETQDTSLEHITGAVDETLAYLEEFRSGNYKIRGIKTPWKKLNYYLGHFENGEVTVVAARPSVGKSAFVSEIILHSAVLEGKKVAYYNLEMNKVQIALRMCSNLLKDTIYNIKRSDMTNMDDIRVAMDVLKKAGIYVNVKAFTIEQIIRTARIQKKKNGLDMVCVDHLTLVGSTQKFESKRAEVEHVSRQLKILSVELDVPVILLSQLNRATEISDTEPELHNLRESGAIEQDATHVIFLHRMKAKEAACGYRTDSDRFLKVKISKNRNGATGEMFMRFISDAMRFIEVDELNGRALPDFMPPNTRPLSEAEEAELPF